MEEEEISPHAYGPHRGGDAVVAHGGDGPHTAVCVQVQTAVFRRLQGLLHQLAVQGLAELEDILLRLPLAHREKAPDLCKADVRPAPEPLRGGHGHQCAAHDPQSNQRRGGGQQQRCNQRRHKPLLEAEASDSGPHPAQNLPHDGFSTILTWVPASRGLLDVVIT